MRKALSFVVACLLVVAAATPSFAQTPPASDAWNISFVPYFMGASMSGTATVKGTEATVDMSASDIFSNLQFGAMGVVVARKGNWGVGADAIWMALGANGTAPGPLGKVTASADFNQGAFSFYGLRRLNPMADVMFGGRVNTLQGNIRVNLPNSVPTFDDSKSWFDPIVGVTLHTPGNGQRWHAQVYTEIGGFGMGSTFTWQIFPTVGVNLGARTALEFGYRWLDINYSTGDGTTLFKYDVLSQGPVMGFRFRF